MSDQTPPVTSLDPFKVSWPKDCTLTPEQRQIVEDALREREAMAQAREALLRHMRGGPGGG